MVPLKWKKAEYQFECQKTSTNSRSQPTLSQSDSLFMWVVYPADADLTEEEMILANAASESKEAEQTIQKAALVLRMREGIGSLARILKTIEVSSTMRCMFRTSQFPWLKYRDFSYILYPSSYGVPVRERYGSTLLPATREQHDQNCTQSH